MRLPLFVLLMLWQLSTTTARAASFDCRLAMTRTEGMICADSKVSELDTNLHAQYSGRRQVASANKAEKSLQSAWLKMRNGCADIACLRRMYEARIAELKARNANASPVIGIWKKEYVCKGAKGTFKERCEQGARDVFHLAISVNGSHVCISHLATAQLGNRVDGSEGGTSGTGSVHGNHATVNFQSSWEGKGVALLRVEGNALHWKVRDKDDGESWIPDEATLYRAPAGPYDRLPPCADQPAPTQP